MTNSVTTLLHCRISDTQNALPSVTPLYQVSAFDAGSQYFYTRKNNPNTAEYELAVAQLEGARYGIAVTTGMAALDICLELLRPGDVLVANSLIYGCSYKLLHRVATRLQLQIIITDLSDPVQLDALPPTVKMVVFETPTNPFLKTIDIQRVSEAIKKRNPHAIIVVDNTWATPMFQRPLAHGADVSIHSGSKYFSGHSDVMAGILLTDREELNNAFRESRFYGGSVLDPHSAWLQRRSLQTLSVRLTHQQRVARGFYDLLKELPQVSAAYYPKVDGVQLTGYGGIIFFELRSDLANQYSRLASSLKWFGTGTGMACVTSMIAQPYTGSHASMTDSEKDKMGIRKNLVRLSFGLENETDLRNDLLEALAAIEAK